MCGPSVISDSVRGVRGRLGCLNCCNSSIETSVTIGGGEIAIACGIGLKGEFPVRSVACILPSGRRFTRTFLTSATSVAIGEKSCLSRVTLRRRAGVIDTGVGGLKCFSFDGGGFFFRTSALAIPKGTLLRLGVGRCAEGRLPGSTRPVEGFCVNSIAFSCPGALGIGRGVLEGLGAVVPKSICDRSRIGGACSELSTLEVFDDIGVKVARESAGVISYAVGLTRSGVRKFGLGLRTSSGSSNLFNVSPRVSCCRGGVFENKR